MIYRGFRQVFWGLILILIEIHIIAFDLLADPIGYYLIFTGVSVLNDHFGLASRARFISLALLLVSIPTVFIENGAIQQMGAFSGWNIYQNALEILNLVLVFFLFQLMLEVARVKGVSELSKRTMTTFKFYMGTMFLVLFSSTFAVNMTTDFLVPYELISVLLSLSMYIVFLLLVSEYSKLTDEYDWDRLNEKV
ncbi:hypothetical protein M3181_16795 [Mesobacillus maritimus]|uniref:hypothetical protein n=1 Tax=Mesobacillus maritimus TaxID=1643336 RepID=UPI00204078DD|nr:hypothetical protein [Mesobacillus maritimus]MCM3670623.1 hypothetical protein [Mesobacillus maritimus]